MKTDYLMDTILDRIHFGNFPDYYFDAFLYVYLNGQPQEQQKMGKKAAELGEQILAFQKGEDIAPQIEVKKILLVMLGNKIAKTCSDYCKNGENVWAQTDKKGFFASAKKLLTDFEDLKQTEEYLWVRKELRYLKASISTDKNKGNIKYLSALFQKSKDTQKLATSLFEIFYSNSEKAQEYYQHLTNGKQIFDLLFKNKPEFHSWRFENGQLMLCGYRMYYGPALEDYIDPSVDINDYRIMEISHRADKSETEKEYQNRMKKVFGKIYETDLEKATNEHRQKMHIEYEKHMDLD